MKPRRKTTSLALAASVGLLPFFLGSCRDSEAQKLAGIEARLGRLEATLAKFAEGGRGAARGSSFHFISVDDSLTPSEDVVEVSKRQHHEIAWVALSEDSTLEVRFDKPQGNPFPKLKCSGDRYCLSGPIDKSATDDFYYMYRVCITPNGKKQTCSDPGIIIHP